MDQSKSSEVLNQILFHHQLTLGRFLNLCAWFFSCLKCRHLLCGVTQSRTSLGAELSSASPLVVYKVRVASTLKIQCCSAANTMKHPGHIWQNTELSKKKKKWQHALFGTMLFTYVKTCALPKQRHIIFMHMHILKTQWPQQHRWLHVWDIWASCFEKGLRDKGRHNNIQIKQVSSTEIWMWHPGPSLPHWWECRSVQPLWYPWSVTSWS